ncbi:MAG: hypothetical protein ACR2N9_06285, partial [Acidimicrobiia bacterium]
MRNDIYSIDGRTFFFNVEFAASVPIGSYVEIALEEGVERYLGQIESATIDESSETSTHTNRTMKGSGALLARLTTDGTDDALGGGFAGATMTAAPTDILADYLADNDSGRASLPIGNLQQSSDLAASLRAGGFGRHTFL